jgi:DNA phosphorothioation-associated putative methyltransferase
MSERGRTAIHRNAVSRPIRLAVKAGYLTAGDSVFDYGCGHGEDVRLLREIGMDVSGFDPVHAPGRKRRADVVNLGYVVNVIEDPAERAEVLREAWSLARRFLIVSVLQSSRHARPRIGSTGTYQWFPSDAAVLSLIRRCTKGAVQRIGPGVWAVVGRPT